MLFGAVEAGGTKFVCVVGDDMGVLRAEVKIPTTTPVETISRAIEFLRAQQALEPLSAIGIGSFGPVDLRFGSPTWGYITDTPKAGWQNVDVTGEIGRALQVPVAFDTDVNAAAWGEHTWGAAQGFDNFLYLTIGTGIGGGGMANGALLHGAMHPELGHVRLPHDWQQDPFPGVCPFHGDCLEGLASGPALARRWGRRAEELPAGHPAWELEAHYPALGVTNWIFTLSPQLIILGGGVMEQAELLPQVRAEVGRLLGGYLRICDSAALERLLVPPGLGKRAGVLGALALARSYALP